MKHPLTKIYISFVATYGIILATPLSGVVVAGALSPDWLLRWFA